jgi:hypothetical protein
MDIGKAENLTARHNRESHAETIQLSVCTLGKISFQPEVGEKITRSL